MKNCSARTVIFPVNHASTNKKNGSQNYFANPLRGVGERSSKKSSGNLTLLKPMHILLIALLSLLLQNNHTHEQTGTLKLQCATRHSRNLSESHHRKTRISSKTNSKGSSRKKASRTSDNTKSTVNIAPNARHISNDKYDIYGSQADSIFGVKVDDEDASVCGTPSVSGSKAPSVSGSKAASVYGSKAASVYGSKAASVYGSKASIVYGSKASSVYGKDDESIMGDQYSSSNSINMDDSTVTLIKNKNPKASAYGAQKGNSNIKNDHENDSASEIMSTIGSESISEESINQDNSADSKNEEQITGKIISDLVNSLGETVKISEMTHIFNLMMALERKKYDNLENDIILYADEAAKKQTATERYKTLEWIRVQYSLMGSVINFEKNAYKTLRYLIKSETQSRAEFINLIKCARNSWNNLRKDKEYMAKEHIAKSMKKFNKKKKYYVYS
ncbi:phist protein (Pf-fam-b) [Plasmodium vivax Brazil I]|uniref:Phist protein (Pf-fam-b) n=2 Tax=Plasmodium vivax TaxID=5855 RepID=A0A0J9STD6_PLAV1|nr:phist protein (Pf-fam-b) [Plasmodium vivax Brazil I]